MCPSHGVSRMKNVLMSKKIILIGSMILLSGCMTVSQSFFAEPSPPPLKNITLPSDFMARKGTIGLIWISWVEALSAEFYTDYNEGKWRATPNPYRDKDLDRVLRQTKLAPLVEKFYLNVFSKAFTDEGFEVIIIETPWPEKNLYDFEAVAKELQVNHLMILEVLAFGNGFVSSFFSYTPGIGFSSVRCSLFDRLSNQVIGQLHAVNAEITQGVWYKPPKFPTLTKAIHSAFERSIDEIFIRIFGRVP